jgi:hypothetical protein
MDDTAQNNQVNNPTAQPAQQIQPSSQINAAQQSEPISSGNPIQTQPAETVVNVQKQFTPVTSSLNKEKGGSAFSEIVKPTEEEVKVEDELTSVGVVANTDKPKLDAIHEQIGVRAAAESATVNVAPSPSANITLPMSEEEVDKALKTKQSRFNLHENIEGEYTEDSLPFFATLIKKVFKEMHRRVFGKKL